jgi:hypothetical protein
MSERLLKTLRNSGAFQAEYEGSIPFTRSSVFWHLLAVCGCSAHHWQGRSAHLRLKKTVSGRRYKIADFGSTKPIVETRTHAGIKVKRYACDMT